MNHIYIYEYSVHIPLVKYYLDWYLINSHVMDGDLSSGFKQRLWMGRWGSLGVAGGCWDDDY